MSAPSNELTEAATIALATWRALPDDERNGERPFIQGFNAGWDEQAARVAELTAALQDIADMTDIEADFEGTEMRRRARAALNQKDQTDG